MRHYFPKDIEPKWQKKWADEKTFQAPEKPSKKKFYCLDMFPYPSGAGLHVGHPLGYIASDILARYKRLNGYDVLHPMGWDAFGLPAENFAIKHGIHPSESTKKNIANFTRQIKAFGFSYDWSREINTSNPEYYRWTQWIFLQLYKKGLAYRKEAAVNWCPSCQTVLANEQVVDGACERCHTKVEQRKLKQWFFKITKYAEELLSGLEGLKWSDRLKTIQRNWIGKSQGAEIDFSIDGTKEKLTVFTTRADTLFGVAYIVISPEHPLLEKIVEPEEKKIVKDYQEEAKKKNDLERTDLAKEKTGVFTGTYAINPVNNKKIPIWVGDYVLSTYGTGAIMGVPAHDERDFAFAKKYNLPIEVVMIPMADFTNVSFNQETGKINEEIIKERVQNIINDEPFTKTENLFYINSGDWTGETVVEKVKKEMVEKVNGRETTTYRLRDWLISRQRYWGAPIPIIYCDTCGEQPVPETDLPVELPTDVDFKPTGESPLVYSKTFHQVKCPKCGKQARRESDTMDTFVCSSWYFLRYPDSQNSAAFADPEKLKSWLPVDLYIGGIEHAVLHLLYARFFVKALRDFGFLTFDEPFLELKNQGLIMGPDNQKMSKSRGNVINPDEVIDAYGADAFRLYEMFMGPFEDPKPWSTDGIKGVSRFLGRVYGLAEKVDKDAADDEKLKILLHKTIAKVTHDIETFNFNTAISTLMILNNECEKRKTISAKTFETFLQLLSPFAPHLTEELWRELGHDTDIINTAWPKQEKIEEQGEEVNIVIQVNGKVRGKMSAKANEEEKTLEERAGKIPPVAEQLKGKTVKRVIHVKNKLINFVVA